MSSIARNHASNHLENSQMQRVFEAQRQLTRQQPAVDYATRLQRLALLERGIKSNIETITNAIVADFGSRSREEIQLAEIYTSLAAIAYARQHLRQWLRPQRRHVSLLHWPARARVVYQPKGVVGIISPWNYPFFLAIGPLIAALAAGNRVMLKPSEISPATAACLQQLLGDIFAPELVQVCSGDADTGKAFAALPFDHLLFTGSTQLGRLIMAAAANNLTPVTLELGGKSPALVHPDYPLQQFASRIIHTKTMNSGQTCVAPDYLLVHESQVDQLVQHLRREFDRCFATIDHNPDYGSIINQQHYQRLQGYLQDARAKGARLVELGSVSAEQPPYRMPLTLVLDVNDSMQLMQEEIFGAILPLQTYTHMDAALDYINQRERPLALYYFDRDRQRIDQVLQGTVSGNACINEALMHVAVDDLPFGGIGASGMGSYHGREGFETFSHKKGVLQKGRFNSAELIKPPYGARVKSLLNFLLR